MIFNGPAHRITEFQSVKGSVRSHALQVSVPPSFHSDKRSYVADESGRQSND